MSKIVFLERHPTSMVMRLFSPKQEFVEKNVENAIQAIARARAIEHEYGRQIWKEIEVVIPLDKRYGDHDCGATAAVLREALKAKGLHASVIEEPIGDIFCGVLNRAIGRQLRNRIDYTLILSTQVASYMNLATLRAMYAAHMEGALVSGPALDELTESTYQGRIPNTFASWHNESLAGVGLFDFAAQKPLLDDKVATFVRGWNKEKGEVLYHRAGVEEIIAQLRLVANHGQCLAPITPQGDGVKEWVKPDPAVDVEGYERFIKKMGTKFARQAIMAGYAGFDLDFLKGGVMQAYRVAPYFD